MKTFNLFFLLISWLLISYLDSAEGILGGTEADSNQFKYIVSVQTDNLHLCGGAIIKEQYVVSAAHCFIGDDNKFIDRKYTILAKVSKFTNDADIGIKTEVEKIFVPQLYQKIKHNTKPYPREIGDIALLKLQKNLDLNDPNLGTLKFPVRLLKKTFLKYTYETPTFIGYGENGMQQGIKRDREQNEIKYSNFNNLKFIKTNVISKTGCKSRFPFEIDDKHLCAQAQQRLSRSVEGTCRGDTGGPLVLDEEYLIGVLAQIRVDCNEQYGPALYTRVTSFVPFLNNMMRETKLFEARILDLKSEGSVNNVNTK